MRPNLADRIWSAFSAMCYIVVASSISADVSLADTKDQSGVWHCRSDYVLGWITTPDGKSSHSTRDAVTSSFVIELKSCKDWGAWASQAEGFPGGKAVDCDGRDPVLNLREVDASHPSLLNLPIPFLWPDDQLLTLRSDRNGLSAITVSLLDRDRTTLPALLELHRDNTEWEFLMSWHYLTTPEEAAKLRITIPALPDPTADASVFSISGNCIRE
jgi:hypothetical protein